MPFLKLSAVFLGVALPLLSFANQVSQNNAHQVLNTTAEAQKMQNSVQTQSQHQALNRSEDRWSEWGLTEQEWTRYEELKKGSRGIWTPNLDPLTMLGVEARSSAERDRIAELLAKKEYERVEKELAFQIAYSAAFSRLYPNQFPFRVDDKGHSAVPTNRVIFFTRTDCGQRCKDGLTRLLNQIGNTPLDIYVVDSLQKDETIRQWAVDNNIDVAKVRSRQITLNHDSGYWLKYAKGKMPAAFHITGNNEWQTLAY